MEQIVIQVSSKKKAKALYELLSALDFVESIKTGATEEEKALSAPRKGDFDFFSLAGLWQDREITLESIRQKAWPRQFR